MSFIELAKNVASGKLTRRQGESKFWELYYNTFRPATVQLFYQRIIDVPLFITLDEYVAEYRRHPHHGKWEWNTSKDFSDWHGDCNTYKQIKRHYERYLVDSTIAPYTLRNDFMRNFYKLFELFGMEVSINWTVVGREIQGKFEVKIKTDDIESIIHEDSITCATKRRCMSTFLKALARESPDWGIEDLEFIIPNCLYYMRREMRDRIY